MADKKQLGILKQGVDVWNIWRKKNNDKDIDLSDAELNGADLFLANLSDANLFCANLNDVDLNCAKLHDSILFGADLNGANLNGAIFKNTKYNKATKWAEGFDPEKIGGLVFCY